MKSDSKLENSNPGSIKPHFDLIWLLSTKRSVGENSTLERQIMIYTTMCDLRPMHLNLYLHFVVFWRFDGSSALPGVNEDFEDGLSSCKKVKSFKFGPYTYILMDFAKNVRKTDMQSEQALKRMS